MTYDTPKLLQGNLLTIGHNNTDKVKFNLVIR